MEIKRKASTGKTRVISDDLFERSHCLVGDYDSRDKACRVADGHNSKRSESMDNVYRVYDDKGYCIRGNEAKVGFL